MASIVILGAGLGGMSAAYEIRESLGNEHAITVVGEGPLFNFTPSNPWVGGGMARTRRYPGGREEATGKRGISTSSTPRRRRCCPRTISVLLRDGRKLDYDYLVITTGPRLAFERVPGTGPDGFSQSVCTGPHAHTAWQAYQEFLKTPRPRS